MVKKVYLKDIASDLKLSKTTVSLVLNGRGDDNNISKDTQQRILQHAEKVNYVPNQMARGLSTGKSRSIGLIIPDISNNFYAEMAGVIELEAEKRGYNVVFSSAHENPENERKLLRAMINRQMDGLLIASTQKNLEELKALKSSGFPFVLVDRHYPDQDFKSVVVDNFNGIKRATEHLIKLGRKKIAFVTIDLELEAILQRQMGYKQAMKNSQSGFEIQRIKRLSLTHYKSEMGEAIEELLACENGIDAIVFATNYLTRAGLRELKAKNVNIPEEVAVVSFDEFSAFDLVDPPISSIKQPVEQIGKKAVSLLLDEIEGVNHSNEAQIVLNTKLLVRKSCGA